MTELPMEIPMVNFLEKPSHTRLPRRELSLPYKDRTARPDREVTSRDDDHTMTRRVTHSPTLG